MFVASVSCAEECQSMHADRLNDLKRFYKILFTLEQKLHGARRLRDCSGKLPWPGRGVYFFMEDGQQRSNSGSGPRIVRVGTHALNAGSRTKLWTRLSQHRGQAGNGGGNHRGSIFRLIVGSSLLARGAESSTWGKGSTAASDIRSAEIELEREVSKIIGAMPFLWVAIDDEPGANSQRGYIERNSIALLSNYGKLPLDQASPDWLGLSCNRSKVRQSGLWNSNHVDERYDPAFLIQFGQLVERMEPV
jgi:hypothetical protein